MSAAAAPTLGPSTGARSRTGHGAARAAAASAPGTLRVDAEGRTWIAGIGEPLPAGETVLWSGAPVRRMVARRVCHVRALTGYFAALCALVFGVQLRSLGAGPATLNTLAMVGMGATVLAFAWVFATLLARSTVYAVTDRRVILRVGVAIPAVLNVPLDRIGAVDLRRGPDGTGDVVLTLTGADRIAYLLLWPHARPWRYAHPQPALRCIADAEAAGIALAQAVLHATAAQDAISGAGTATATHDVAAEATRTTATAPDARVAAHAG